MQPEKHIRTIRIKNDLSAVKIGFEDTVEVGEEGTIVSNKHTAESKFKPNKSFITSIKKLRKFALEICEIETDARTIKNWTVSAVKIDGDIYMQQSRVSLTLSKFIERTGKYVEMKSEQVTMFPREEDLTKYHDAENLTKHIEDVIAEAIRYLGGWYDEESEGQLPLFENVSKYELNITR